MKLHIDIDPYELYYLIQMLQHPKQPGTYNQLIANILHKRMPDGVVKIIELAREFCDTHLEALDRQYQDRYGPTDEEAKEWYTSIRAIKTKWQGFLRRHNIFSPLNQPLTPNELIEYIQERYNVKASRNGRIDGLIITK